MLTEPSFCLVPEWNQCWSWRADTFICICYVSIDYRTWKSSASNELHMWNTVSRYLDCEEGSDCVDLGGYRIIMLTYVQYPYTSYSCVQRPLDQIFFHDLLVYWSLVFGDIFLTNVCAGVSCLSQSRDVCVLWWLYSDARKDSQKIN